MTSNLDRFKALDDAYNSRDWDGYGSFLDDGFRGWTPGDPSPHGKTEHVRQAQEFCAVSADNRVHNSTYVVGFAANEWTCTIARFTGVMTGPLKTAEGATSEPTNRAFDTIFATIARWAGGRIVEEFEFLDAPVIMRQVGAEM